MNVSTVRLCWAAGMLIWYFLFLRRTRDVMPRSMAAELALAAMLSGVLGGHVLYWLAVGHWAAYSPLRGFDSTGALAGAAAGAIVWVNIRRYASRWLSVADAAFFAFAIAWIPVRLGCVFEGAHAGRRTESLLGRAFADGVRWDLALLEMLWAVAVAALLLVWPTSWRRHGLVASMVIGTLALTRAAMLPLAHQPGTRTFWPVVILGCGAIVALAATFAHRPSSKP